MNDFLLGKNDPAPVSVENPSSDSEVVFLCQHGGRAIPDKLQNLEADDDVLASHAGWDIGTDALCRALANLSGATTIFANYSRLVIDVNRSEQSRYLIPNCAEHHMIDVNIKMGLAEKAQRIDEIFTPYHRALSMHIERIESRGKVPIIIDVHSFTPQFYKFRRPWDIGVLWLRYDHLARSLMSYFAQQGLNVGDNKPYDARKFHDVSLYSHAEAKGIPNAVIEFNNEDLIDSTKVDHWAKQLWLAVQSARREQDFSKYNRPAAGKYNEEIAQKYFDALVHAAREGRDLS